MRSTVVALVLCGFLDAASPAAAATPSTSSSVVADAQTVAASAERVTTDGRIETERRARTRRANGFVFAETLAVGTASTQFAGAVHTYASPALRTGVTFTAGHAVDALVEFDDREFAGRGSVVNCSDSLRSLPCDLRASHPTVRSYSARDWIVQEHAGFRIPTTPVYLDFANRYRASTYAKIDVEGIGFGLEAPPTVTANGLFGSALFFPNVLNEHGVFPTNHRASIPVRYSVAQYEAGATRRLMGRVFFDGGIRGDSSWRLINAPSEGTKLGLFLGTGARL